MNLNTGQGYMIWEVEMVLKDQLAPNTTKNRTTYVAIKTTLQYLPLIYLESLETCFNNIILEKTLGKSVIRTGFLDWS